MHRKKLWSSLLMTLLCVCTGILLSGCDRTEFSDLELAAAIELTGNHEMENVSEEVITEVCKEEFPSVKKVYKTPDGIYVFASQPVGYNGPIFLVTAIDSRNGKTTGMRIVKHYETKHYVRDMESPWFVDRFADKSAYIYMVRTKLEAKADNEIVAVTGSTVTTDAIVDGVNDAFGVYQSLKLPIEDEGTLLFTDEDGNEIGRVTLDEIKKLDSYRRSLVIRSGQEGDTRHDFRGARLSEIIGLLDESLLSEYGILYLEGTDGYSTELTMEEVLMENNAYVMYSDFEKPIESLSGQAGGMRLIVLEDHFGQRFTNSLYRIKLSKLQK